MASTVKTTKPIIDERPERHTAGIRLKAPIRDFKKIIPPTLTEVLSWVKEHGVGTGDPPFMRLYVINMEGEMDMELGVPVARRIQPDGRITPGVLPTGRYASLIYTGRDRGYAGNGVLINWGQKAGIEVGCVGRSRGRSLRLPLRSVPNRSGRGARPQEVADGGRHQTGRRVRSAPGHRIRDKTTPRSSPVSVACPLARNCLKRGRAC